MLSLSTLPSIGIRPSLALNRFLDYIHHLEAGMQGRDIFRKAHCSLCYTLFNTSAIVH
jgi:hypothetical protein